MADYNKNISDNTGAGITYNHLNLPSVISFPRPTGGFNTIAYQYDAGGNKLMKTVDEDGRKTITTYLGSIVYEKVIPVGTVMPTDVVQFIGHRRPHPKREAF